VAPEAPENRRTALMQDLLRGIAGLLAPDSITLADASVQARPSERVGAASLGQRALVVADEAIRIDPASASLRDAASNIQHAADAADPIARAKALAAAATAAAAEARRAHADPPLQLDPAAAGLGGAFAEAMRTGLKAAVSNGARR